MRHPPTSGLAPILPEIRLSIGIGNVWNGIQITDSAFIKFMPARNKTSSHKDSSATIGFESRPCGIWLTADKLRNNMDAAEYKQVVLGLIFLAVDKNAAGKRGLCDGRQSINVSVRKA